MKDDFPLTWCPLLLSLVSCSLGRRVQESPSKTLGLSFYNSDIPPSSGAVEPCTSSCKNSRKMEGEEGHKGQSQTWKCHICQSANHMVLPKCQGGWDMLSSCVSRRKRKSGLISIEVSPGFPDGSSGEEPICQCKRHKTCGFDPWVRKIPWRRAWQPTPVFMPEESYGQRSLADCSP